MSRVGWVDSVKGIGIILVVIGHTWRGLFAADVPISLELYQFVDRAIYSFHMPLFFFCAGLFLLNSVAKTSPSRFLRDRVVRLLWPLVLWTWVFFLLKSLAGPFQNTPISISEFPIIPLPPQLHFWFLWALFVVSICSGLVLYLVQKPLSRQSLRLFCFGFAILLLVLADLLPWSNSYWGPAYGYAGFFVFGASIGAWPSNSVSRSMAWALLALAVALIGFATTGIRTNVYSMVIILALCGGLSGLSASEEGETGKIWHVLSYLGASSLAIYMLHTAFSAALREAFLWLGVDSLPLHLIAGNVAGIIMPLIILSALRSGKLNSYFGL